MALASGTHLGTYEIQSALGAGGMGEVYRARDTRLGRDVAIKVLPEAFAADPDRLARFEREAKILASLNHPNIAGIHGIEDAGAVRALVLEFVDGPTLADRIAQGRMPLEEARPIARQIAEALEAAHEHGIVHRDLKPANIKLRPDGTVKVLDFGLAKALSPPEGGHYVRPGSPDGRSVRLQPDLTASPTITTPAMTQAGMILGTAAYMSPEQARGHAADKRSDVWAFGCVLYEMLTGRRAFDGEDVSDTLAAILRGEPDWSALPSDLPPAIAELMKGSLAKDRRRRIADLAVASFVLAESSAARDVATRARAPRTLARRAIAAAVVALLAGAGLAGAWWMGARSAPAEPGPVTRFVIPLRSGEQFSQADRSVIALSPDGTSLAYVANGRLNLRRIDQLDSVPIRGTESGANVPGAVRSPFFSPDGRWIGFWQDGQIKIPLAGGAAVSIAAVSPPFGATWEDDGTIVFAEGTTIWRVPEAGGTPEPLVRDLKGVPQNPQLLAGARAVLFTLFPEGTARAEGLEPEIVVHALDSGRHQTLIRGGIDARYIPTGHLVYFSNSTLLAVPFELRALNTTGSPVAVAENVASGLVGGRSGNGIAQVAISGTGTLAYVTGSFLETGPRALVSVDRLGREELLGLPPRAYVYPRLSPDGTRIALTVRDPEMDIWIWDIARKTLSRFTFDPADDRYSSWSPDGRWIAFGSTRGGEAGVWRQAADGTGVAERLAAFPFNRYNFLVPTAMTPDGSRLVATATPGGGNFGGTSPDVFVVGSGADREPTPLLQSGFAERNAELAPDGAWVAYESAESGQLEVYVPLFPDVPGGKWQISTDGGSQALWSRDGNELFFVAAAGGLMSVRVERGGPLKIGTPTRVLDGSYLWTVPAFAGRLYDVTPDGRRFILLKDAGLSQQTNLPESITVVQNWDQELKRLVPAN